MGPSSALTLEQPILVLVIYKKSRVEIIPNYQGNRTTPSYVPFTDEERLIGEAGKIQATINPSQTLFDPRTVDWQSL